MLKNFSASLERAVLNWVNVDRYLPLQIDITNACNLRCKHCYHPHHQNAGALELSDWLAILDQYDALASKLRFRPSVIICGGEPFLSKHFEPILQNLLSRKRAYALSVLTNGTIVDPAKLALLKQFPELSVQVSLDGPNAEDHDSVRGAGNFARALNGIRVFREHGIKVQLSAVLSKRTSRTIGKFFDLARELNVNGMGFARLIVQGYAQKLVTENEDRPLSPLELRDAYRAIIMEAARTEMRTSTNSPLFHLVQPGLGRNGRFWEGIVIDYKGNYLASSRSRLALGDARSEGLENIFLRHPLLQRLRRQDVKVCGSCPHYAVCGGDRNAAYADSGDFLGADPGCWLSMNQNQTA
jgi:MoaA/NifB/PqqE/SkfB family radical SAM enzyme